MRSRWTACCARLVPASLRATAFEPAVADLELEFRERARAASGIRRRLLTLLFGWTILTTALECRRLHAVGAGEGAARPRRHSAALWSDLRTGVRVFRRAPFLTSTVVLLLGLGIGVNVAVFSFANAYLLAPLPVEAPERLVRVYGRSAARQFDVVSYPRYRETRAALRHVALAAHAEAAVRVGPPAERLAATAELVSGNFFEVMRVRPVAGRLITPADDLVEGAHPVIVVGEIFWRAHFDADPRLVGRTMLVNGAPFQVVGIAPAAFRGASSAYAVSDLWTSLAMHRQVRPRGSTREDPDWGWLSMIGRLNERSTMAAAQAELAQTAAILNSQTPAAYAVEYEALPASALPESDRRRTARVLSLSGALTALVLVAACANLAGVMQARFADRRREIAVRRALGASPSQLVRLLFVETAIVAGLAGAGGLAGGRLAATLIDRWRPPAQLAGDLSFQTALDGRVLVFTVGLTVVCAVIVGLWPAIAAARASSSPVVAEEAPASSGGRLGARLRRVAIGLQVGVAVVLLLIGGVLLRSVLLLNRVDVGFEARDLAAFWVSLRGPDGPAADGRQMVATALQRVGAIPGVASAAIANALPLGVAKDRLRVRIPGYELPDGRSGVSVSYSRVSHTYFDTLGIRLRRGGVWAGSIDAPAGVAIVINETMARRFWSGRDPVGSSIEIVGRGAVPVVGVASDTVYYALGEEPIPFMYVPAETAFPDAMAIVVRGRAPLEGLMPIIEREIAAVDHRLAPSSSATFDELRRVPLYPARAFAAIATTFGTLALLLTAVGLYAVVAGTVGQRTREFGVRLALGARASQIVGGVLREALGLAVAGVALGVGTGVLLAGTVRSWLFGVAAVDPVTYGAVAGFVLLVSLLAAWMPARRASRIDPAAALRV